MQQNPRQSAICPPSIGQRFPYVCVFDTTIADNNLGNRIIMDGVHAAVHAAFGPAHVVSIPYIEGIGRECQSHLGRADAVFFGGGNCLSGRMRRARQWGFTLLNSLRIQRFTLLGVGWWKYEDAADVYSRLVLRRMLDPTRLHAVRDGYSLRKLQGLGFDNVVNTGCPSLWSLTPIHCRSIPHGRSDDAVLTFTEYCRDADADRALFRVVAERYRHIHVWPQQPGDFDYAMAIGGSRVRMLAPSLEALDRVLREQAVDYIGTRLHAGIRAMQHHRRSIIIGVDNRAAEMGRDVNLPVLNRADIEQHLAGRIESEWATDLALNTQAITAWCGQFGARPALPRNSLMKEAA